MNNSEWNINANKRYQQILSGVDLTFNYVFLPLLKDTIQDIPIEYRANVLEIGCGPGILAGEIAPFVENITCIDHSEEMVKVAKEHNKYSANITVYKSSLENFCPNNLFTMCISHMVFHNIKDILSAFKTVGSILCDGGIFIFTIPHPCFFSFYKSDELQGYDYMQQNEFSIKFVLSLDKNPLPNSITYYHRKLSDYVNYLSQAGLYITRMYEPFPAIEVMSKYPEPWKYPRYLLFSTVFRNL